MDETTNIAIERDDVETTHDMAHLLLDFIRAIGYDYVNEVSLKYDNGQVVRSNL